MHLQCPICRSPLQLHEASRGSTAPTSTTSIPRRKAIWISSPARRIPGQRQPRPDARQTPLPRAGPPAAAGRGDGQPACPLEPRELIHLGCGEGYYCRTLAERLPGWQFAGVDIAKNTIFAANKAQPDAQFVIADPARAPLLPGTAQLLLVNDLKVKTEQLVSWLAPGGYLLYLQPGPATSGS